MIIIKDNAAIKLMRESGKRLAATFEAISPLIKPGVSSLEIDKAIEDFLKQMEMKGSSKGYMGYNHVSCISFNDEVVHGIPSAEKIIKLGDVIKIDICASWHGYCADMARTFMIGAVGKKIEQFIYVAQEALDAGIQEARSGKRLSDISAAVQQVVERHGYSIVRDFAGHGIGKKMHEAPEIVNFGRSGQGPLLKPGMTLAIEPMITMGDYPVYIAEDGWTVKTKDKSLAAHVEDTVLITEQEPEIFTRFLRGGE